MTLENSIQIALKTNSITLSDAIDIRQVSNLRLANQMLKLKQKQKAAEDNRQQQQMLQALAQANAQQAEASALAEVQKREAIAQTELQLETGKAQLDLQKLETEMGHKMTLAEQKFRFDMQLAQVDVQKGIAREQMIENRKDQRTKLSGTQQSYMINQRKNNLLPKDFVNQNENVGSMDLGSAISTDDMSM